MTKGTGNGGRHARTSTRTATPGITTGCALLAIAAIIPLNNVYGGTEAHGAGADGTMDPGYRTGNITQVSRSESRADLGTEDASWALDGASDRIDVDAMFGPSPQEKAQATLAAETAKAKAAADAWAKTAGGYTDGMFTNDPVYQTTAEAAHAAEYVAVTPPAGFDPNHDTGDNGNAYSFSQCTWWAYVRRHQLNLPAGSHLGDGRMWVDSAAALGYWTGGGPQVGDAISFKAGQQGSDGYYGHVAIVEAVLPDGSILTSECGASFNGKPFQRWFSKDTAATFTYMHI